MSSVRIGRRSFMAALAIVPPSPSPLTWGTSAPIFTPVWRPLYRCPIHGELQPGGTIAEYILVVRVYEPDKTKAGPVCLYCAVDFLTQACPKLEKIG